MNYPKGTKINNKEEHHIQYGNRGMDLEEDINITNQYYIEQKIAYIYKKPTPIQVTKVDYKTMTIKEAYFKEPSTTDYNGLYKGFYIDFEAKETNQKLSFPLKNIHRHQIEHIRHIMENGGIVFLIVRFTKLDKNYILLGKDLIQFVDNTSRKSIPLEYFATKGFEVSYHYHPRLDYLKVIDGILGGGMNGQEKTSKIG